MRHFDSVQDYMTRRMPHLVNLYSYTDTGSIADLNRDFSWNGYCAFELDVFASDMAEYEAVNGAIIFTRFE